MTRLTQIMLIATVIFAVALVPDATEAATLTIEVREPDATGGTRSIPSADVIQICEASPTGIQEINRLSGTRIEADIWDAIDKALRCKPLAALERFIAFSTN